MFTYKAQIEQTYEDSSWIYVISENNKRFRRAEGAIEGASLFTSAEGETDIERLIDSVNDEIQSDIDCNL